MRVNRMIAFGIVAAGCASLAPAQTGVAQAQDKAETKPAPYTLGTCPVSGEKLGGMGDAVVRVYDGREVRFCCKNCVAKFEADQDKYFAEIDEKIVKDQLPYYPLGTCIVSGESLTEDGEDVAANFVYDNRLFRLCCNKCKAEVTNNPAEFLAKLDKAAADAQRADYPLEACPVSDGKLGSMGEPYERVFAGRLIRFCCDGCPPKVEADPVKYLAMIDKAWHGEGRGHDDAREEHGKDGHEEHERHGHDDG